MADKNQTDELNTPDAPEGQLKRSLIVVDEPTSDSDVQGDLDTDAGGTQQEGPGPSSTKTKGRPKSPTSKATMQLNSLNYRLRIQYRRHRILLEEVDNLETYLNSSLTAADLLAKQDVIDTYWRDFLNEHNALITNCTQQFMDSEYVTSVPPTGEMFESAWETLTKRYENKRILTTAQVDRLLKLPKLTSKSADALNGLISTLTDSLNALKALGSPVQHWDHLLVPLVTSKLDVSTKEAWENRQGASTEMPKLQALIDFITDRARAQESLESVPTSTSFSSAIKSSPKKTQKSARTHTTSVQPQSSQTSSTSTHQHSSRTHPQSTQPSTSSTQSHSSAGSSTSTQPQSSRVQQPASSGSTQKTGTVRKPAYPCDMCGDPDHYIVTCQDFYHLTRPLRIDHARRKKLCDNCLGHHKPDACGTEKRCKHCGGKHHTMLHNFANPSGTQQCDHTLLLEHSHNYSGTHPTTHASSHSTSNSRAHDKLHSRTQPTTHGTQRRSSTPTTQHHTHSRKQTHSLTVSEAVSQSPVLNNTHFHSLALTNSNTQHHNSPSLTNTDHNQLNSPNASSDNSQDSQVLLATSLANLITPTRTHTVRILVDPCSEVPLVSEALVKLVKLPRQRSSLFITGVGAAQAERAKGKAALILRSRYSKDSVNVGAHILKELTGLLPSFSATSGPLSQFAGLQLADPDYMVARPVDIILGADVYGQIIKPEVRSQAPGKVIAQLTIFGWIIIGPIDSSHSSLHYAHHATIDQDTHQLDELLTKFWTQEEVPVSLANELTTDEAACEAHFKATHSRDPTGRYVVRLPLISSPSQLGDSSRTAHHCLQHLLRRLDKNSTYKEMYSSFLKEYEALGPMTRISDQSVAGFMSKGGVLDDRSKEMTLTHGASAPGGLRVPEEGFSSHLPAHQSTDSTQHSFYLPHHGVLREDSKTTKLRVVFNGSRKTQSGVALTDILHTGPELQKDITDVLLWIRRHKFIFSTDITKMFCQISVDQRDWDLQRILWIDEHNNPTHYHLTTVTYGTRPAPYLAVRVLLQLVEDEGHKYPLAINPLTHGRYVDDIFGGADTLPELQETADQVSSLCKAGGFPLAKWTSNHKRLKQYGQAEAKAKTKAHAFTNSTDTHAFNNSSRTHAFNDSTNTHAFMDSSASSTKVLGLHWSPTSDHFFFKIKPPTKTQKLTKRLILSEIAQIFDPLGFLSPLTIRAKIFMQELWLVKLGRDDNLPQQLSDKWSAFKEELTQIPTIQIPRWIKLTTGSQIEIHGFSDSSQRALAAVVYIKVHKPQSGTHSTMVCSKTKVAPVNPLTIPRLELGAAVLLAKLIKYCQETLNLTHVSTYLWTDSSVTLTWLHSSPSRWKDFVRNRVALIDELVPNGRWRFVPGKENPADCASRGLTLLALKTHPLWWSGPPWLLKNSQSWPTHEFKLDPEAPLEERPGMVNTISTTSSVEGWELIQKYSSLTRLLRITAMIFRAVALMKKQKNSSLNQPINAIDIDNALMFWVKYTQANYFGEELKMIDKGVPWPKGHAFARLTAHLDAHGVIRVGGRLENSSLTHDSKHLAILPRSSVLTKLIISDAHQQTLHGGTHVTLGFIRQQFWILGGRQPVRSLIYRCTTCARHRAQRAQQLMGQLPEPRVIPSPAFTNTGVDYAGPIPLKTWKGRGAKTSKGWICAFVCLTTSAIHLEVVTDYSTEAFIAAFRRFSGRRGLCRVLYSDCGTNFQGAEAEITHSFTQDKITWKFNPPAAPHMGGKWEAAVKLIKTHPNRTLGDTLLTYEEFTTLLIQVEAVLNSRPLEALTEDPDDLSVLTPGHFLVGRPLNTLPEPSLIELNCARLNRYQLIQQKLQNFWTDWSSSYLQQPQAISKWHTKANNIKVGSIVLITDDRFPPSKWPLAWVLELHPGKDGLTRVVTIKTATVLKRPITKLAVLPIEPDDLNSPSHSTSRPSSHED